MGKTCGIFLAFRVDVSRYPVPLLGITGCSLAGSGISSYADDPAGAGASLKPCLDKAMTVIPAEQQWQTPTYLGATAGMRLLRYGHCPQHTFQHLRRGVGLGLGAEGVLLGQTMAMG